MATATAEEGSRAPSAGAGADEGENTHPHTHTLPSSPQPAAHPPQPDLLPTSLPDPDGDEDDGDESQQFWDVQTTADRSPSSSPPPGVPASAANRRRTSGHLRDASFTTAVEFSASASSGHPPSLELTTASPLPVRLYNERQRWLLSGAQSGERTSRTVAISPEQQQQQFELSPAPSSASSLKRSPASNSSHGTATNDGPPPSLLNRRAKSRDPATRSPSSRTLLQRGLQPLKSLASRGSRKAQDTDATTTAGAAYPQDDSAQERDSHDKPNQAPNSPRSNPPDERMESRPRSSRRQMQDLNGAMYAASGYDDALAPENLESSTEGQSSEDLFLNLARDTQSKEVEPAHDGLERKRSRLSRGGQRQSLPSSHLIDRTDTSDRDSGTGPPSAYENNQRMYSRRPSQVAPTGLGGYREASPASSTSRIEALSRLDQYRQRYMPSQKAQSVVNGPKSPDLPRAGHRRPSLTNDLPSPGLRGQAYRPSKLNSALQDFDSSSVIDTPPQGGRHRAPSMTNGEGNESVISGPSAMWDELEELKSRIKRMERSGTAASTSGVAVQSSTSGSNERPRTATTTVTTISSSPKHNRNQRKALSPPLASPNEDAEAAHGVYPLLNQALARCKSVLSPTIYRVLDAMASEAIEIATMTGNTGPQGPAYTSASVINGAGVADRQIRRKADNMCRTITELCIALCEQNQAPSRPGTSSNSPAVVKSIEERPGSRRGQPNHRDSNEESPASGSYARHAIRGTSLEPEGANGEVRSSPSRALSRIEARRNSVNVLATGNSASNSPREPRVVEAEEPLDEEETVRQQRISSIPNRFSRAGTSLLRSRRRVGDGEADDDPTLRPMSRAMTDIGGSRDSQLRVPSLRERVNQRLSREYTSKEPLPDHAPMPQGSQSSLRRVTGNHLPQSSNPRQSDIGRRYAERTAPPVAYESNDRSRISSAGTLYPASRRSSAGLSLAAGRKTRQSGFAIEAGAGDQQA